jgi:hypothetical protein
MLTTSRVRRSMQFAAALALLATTVACKDDPVEPEPEPEIQTMTLTVGASTISVDATTGAASGELVVPLGASTVTATFRKADGTNETLVTSDEFDLKFTPTDPTRLSWVANGAFGGTLTATGLTSGQTTTAQVSLFHKEEQHDDFGPFTITVRIQ